MVDSDEKYDIVPPVTVTKVTVMSKFTIQRVDIHLKQSANITIDLIDNNGNYAGTEYLVMSGDDYSNWGSDDDYLINWVKNNLNL
jgi:hypothetical protein